MAHNALYFARQRRELYREVAAADRAHSAGEIDLPAWRRRVDPLINQLSLLKQEEQAAIPRIPGTPEGVLKDAINSALCLLSEGPEVIGLREAVDQAMKELHEGLEAVR